MKFVNFCFAMVITTFILTGCGIIRDNSSNNHKQPEEYIYTNQQTKKKMYHLWNGKEIHLHKSADGAWYYNHKDHGRTLIGVGIPDLDFRTNKR